MTQSFKYNGLTIEVREQTGVDLIDNPELNRYVLEYVTGIPDATIANAPPLVWNRLTTYVDFMQISTVKGKGLTLPSSNSTREEIGKGYAEWLTFITEHVHCYREWARVINEVNKKGTDPQAESVEVNSTDESKDTTSDATKT